MNFISNLLGWTGYFENDPKVGWMAKVFGPISIALWVILGLVGAAGAIYAIYLGIQLARADDDNKREEAKKHLITTIIAVAVTLVLILFFNELLPLIVKAIIGDSLTPPVNPSTTPADTAIKLLMMRF